jgi:hypothetical protein
MDQSGRQDLVKCRTSGSAGSVEHQGLGGSGSKRKCRI